MNISSDGPKLVLSHTEWRGKLIGPAGTAPIEFMLSFGKVQEGTVAASMDWGPKYGGNQPLTGTYEGNKLQLVDSDGDKKHLVVDGNKITGTDKGGAARIEATRTSVTIDISGGLPSVEQLMTLAMQNLAGRRGVGDDVLLVQALLIVAAADGQISPDEMRILEVFAASVPDFRGKSFAALVERAKKAIDEVGGANPAIIALAGLPNAAMKKKCFVLAAELAFCTGKANDATTMLLSRIQNALGVDREFAVAAIGVLVAKYAH